MLGEDATEEHPAAEVRIAPNAKVYDPLRNRVPLERYVQNFGGFAALWADPKTGLITHIFWSDDTG